MLKGTVSAAKSKFASRNTATLSMSAIAVGAAGRAVDQLIAVIPGPVKNLKLLKVRNFYRFIVQVKMLSGAFVKIVVQGCSGMVCQRIITV